jgi:glycosyltransferase involved in cell wall biosynthesis
MTSPGSTLEDRSLPAIAYLTSLYPAISHTFIQREVLELRRRGVKVETFSIRPAPRAHLLTEQDRDEAARTATVLPCGVGRLVAIHAASLVRRPLRYLSTLGRALALSPGGARAALWQLFYFAEAMVLHRMLAERGIRHVHVHFANVSADVAMLVAEFADRPGERWSWSFTMHGSTEFYDVEQHRLRQKIESADAVACISDFTRSQMMRSVGAEHWPKLGVVRCGIDPDVYDAPSAPGAPGALEVLFVGRLVEAKGAALLVEAVAQAREAGRDVRLVLVGDGPERPRLERLVGSLGLKGHVELAGAVGQDRIRSYYSSADALCLPSLAEGVPVVLMEAMAMRRPVVATRIMGVPELVEHEVSGLLVAPGRIDELRDALMRLADDPGLRASLGETGRAKVVAGFRIDASAEALGRLLASRLPGGSARAGRGSRRETSSAIPRTK